MGPFAHPDGIGAAILRFPMQRVKKSVLVPYAAAEMFELVDRVDLYPQFLPWCGGTQVQNSRTNRQDGADRHRLPRCARAFHDRQRQRSTAVDRRHVEGRPVSAFARRMAVPCARGSRLRDRVLSSPTSSRRRCSKSRRPRGSTTSRTRSSTLSCTAPKRLRGAHMSESAQKPRPSQLRERGEAQDRSRVRGHGDGRHAEATANVRRQ